MPQSLHNIESYDYKDHKLYNFPPNLRTLKINNLNKIKSQLDQLENLYVVNCNIDSLVDKMKKLKTLNIKNSIKNISCLKNLPDTLLEIIIHAPINSSIPKLPDSIIKLELDNNSFEQTFNKPLTDLPSNLLILIINGNYNQPIDNFPKKLQKLSLGNYFNQPIDKLPESLQELTLGSNFNQSLDNLPKQLKKIEYFFNYFDKPINWLPNIIKNLRFGHNFNQLVDKLPNSIINLTFGHNFNQSVDKLPNSIRNLTFGYGFNNKINNLPDSVIELNLPCSYNNCLTNFPQKLKKIHIPANTKVSMDDSMTNLEIMTYTCKFNQSADNLQKTLLSLKLILVNLRDCPNLHNINNLPETLKHLIIDCDSESIIEPIILPKNLVTLRTTGFFNSEIVYYPPTLEEIRFGHNFNKSIDNLPPNLKKLTIKNGFSQIINKLPSSLLSLRIFNSGNNVQINYIPQSLTSFTVSHPTDNMLCNLPDTLVNLTIYNTIGIIGSLNLPILLKNINIREKDKLIKIPFGCNIFKI